MKRTNDPAQLSFTSPRLAREWQTVVAMIRLSCAAQHGHAGDLCPECQQLQEYAGLRLERCRFGDEKPTCARCPVHCYQRERREQVRAIMRVAGPRMLWHHPILSLRHWLDGFRPAPEITGADRPCTRIEKPCSEAGNALATPVARK